MISVVCFKWRPGPGYRSEYKPATVNTLASMVRRNYGKPHRFICVTDDAEGLDPDVEVVPLWDDYASLPNPSFRTGPSCYRRLKVFSREIGSVLGERFVCMDLDTVITGDITPLLDQSDDFIAWRNPDPRWPINGSLFMLTAGSRPHVWDDFDPVTSPTMAHAAGCWGSDQGWMSYVLKGERTWGPEDGVYSYRQEVARRGNRLPKHARMVMFHGHWDPWDMEAQKVAPWIREHYW